MNYAPNMTLVRLKTPKDLITYNKIHFPQQQKTQIKPNTNQHALTREKTQLVPYHKTIWHVYYFNGEIGFCQQIFVKDKIILLVFTQKI